MFLNEAVIVILLIAHSKVNKILKEEYYMNILIYYVLKSPITFGDKGGSNLAQLYPAPPLGWRPKKKCM